MAGALGSKIQIGFKAHNPQLKLSLTMSVKFRWQIQLGNLTNQPTNTLHLSSTIRNAEKHPLHQKKLKMPVCSLHPASMVSQGEREGQWESVCVCVCVRKRQEEDVLRSLKIVIYHTVNQPCDVA